jgi:uncharacterized protein
VTAPLAFDPTPAIARGLKLPEPRVAAAVRLLDDGNTVPFIARYRKEATGTLDEVQLRDILAKKTTLEALEARRQTILDAIRQQGKLTPDLEEHIRSACSRSSLEDLYLPYKQKRRTRASMARDRGLEPLADELRSQGNEQPELVARGFVRGEEVPDVDAALAGARDIVAEQVSEHAAVRADARRALFARGDIVVKATKKGRSSATPFDDYADHVEAVRRIAPHRFQAILRGEKEGMLKARIAIDESEILPGIEERMGLQRRSPWAEHLALAVRDAWSRLLLPSLESELRGALKARADQAAVEVFAKNLEAILMAAPLGAEPVLAIDPGLRTGSKLVALDAGGGLRAHDVLHLTKSAAAREAARATLMRFVEQHNPVAIAVGNGTGGRETEAFCREVLSTAGRRNLPVVAVNEAGASVYSASDVARVELGGVDLTVRGAVSIGRRLQDPLAELVKIDPKSLGVGQYQHDLPAAQLDAKLGEVVESCVNKVGVELSTASAALLSHVAGIGPRAAQNVVDHRDAQGGFRTRRDLLKVKGIGPKAFEQCAGFLRLRAGAHPLDASAVHPERYGLVERMAADLGTTVDGLVGQPEAAKGLNLQRYVDDHVGLPTLQDILHELEKPGRDPRAEFSAPHFREDVHTMDDLEPGMALEGVVTNVVAFGAFVDVGVHQDGLVHVSQLADRYISEPAEVVRTGDRLKVKVLSVDLARKRISLSVKQAG